MMAEPSLDRAQDRNGQSLPASALAQALMNSERRFHALNETSLQGKLVHRRFKPLYCNTAFAYLAGCDRPDEVLSRDTVLPFLDEETRANPDAAWVRLLHGPAIFGRRTLRRRDGSLYAAEIYARAVEWDGEPAVAIAILDVSEEERTRQSLKDSQALAEAAARAKRRFLSAASHELRTPLHGALGRLQVLTETKLSSAAKALAHDALEACQDLARRIDDVLDAAALDARALTLTREPFWLKQIIDAAQVDIAPVAEAAGVRLADPIVDAHARMMGDPRAVRRIVGALLEGAVRRLPARCCALEVQAEAGGLAIAVRAEGALRGPPVDEEEDAQTPFCPLTTARRLAAAHEGVLVEWAETPSLWSASVYLPLERLDAGPDIPLFRTLEVLAIEDNPGARALLKVALETLGHRPTIASSGPDALEILEARGFDVVLMDLAMPGMNGIETAKRVRALNTPWAHVPIAALTASCAPGVREEIADAGMDAFLRKPVDIPQLAETLALLGARSIEAAEVQHVQEKDQADKADHQSQRFHAQVPSKDGRV